MDLEAAIDSTTCEHFRALLGKVGSLQCRVMTDSMAPLLAPGDRIVLEPVSSFGTLRRFDILVFRYRERLYCHFLWNRSRFGGEMTFTTRSLKEPLKDDVPVGVGEILGRVRGRAIPLLTRLRIIALNLLRGTA